MHTKGITAYRGALGTIENMKMEVKNRIDTPQR